jgi:hypothetical protein
VFEEIAKRLGVRRAFSITGLILQKLCNMQSGSILLFLFMDGEIKEGPKRPLLVG